MRHHLFLACKESLNNIRKHAHANEVWIRVALDANELRLAIEDNGVGISPRTEKPTGNGLHNLHDRLATLGGRCEIISQPGQGTRVIMAIQLPSAPPAVK
jgi:protein-histidine pros-kinase